MNRTITAAELAGLSGYIARYISMLSAKGILPAKVGRARFDRAATLAALDAHKAQQAAWRAGIARRKAEGPKLKARTLELRAMTPEQRAEDRKARRRASHARRVLDPQHADHIRAVARARRAANPELERARSRARTAANREERQRARLAFEQSPEGIAAAAAKVERRRASKKAWAQQNRPWLAAAQRTKRLANLDAIRAADRLRAKGRRKSPAYRAAKNARTRARNAERKASTPCD